MPKLTIEMDVEQDVIDQLIWMYTFDPSATGKTFSEYFCEMELSFVNYLAKKAMLYDAVMNN